jgi:predicted DNA-binding transcriptional regulator AlpA
MSSIPPIDNPFEQLSAHLYRIENRLLELNRQVEELAHSKHKPLTDTGINLAVRITGLQKKTIYNLVSQRSIPHSKKGKRLYFDEQELLTWIKSGKRKTKEEWFQTHG